MTPTGGVLLEPRVQRWECPNCPVTDVTRGETNRFHRCRGEGVYAGLFAPLVPAGVSAKVTVRERDDYIGDERVQYHQGRPVMAVVTEREEGQDCMVFAPAARMIGGAR